MAWRRPGDKPLSETMMIILPTYMYVTRPQWVIPFLHNRSTPRHYLLLVAFLHIEILQVVDIFPHGRQGPAYILQPIEVQWMSWWCRVRASAAMKLTYFAWIIPCGMSQQMELITFIAINSIQIQIIYCFQCLKLSQNCRSSCIKSQIISIKLKKKNFPGPPPELSASDLRTCGNFQHWLYQQQI